MRFLIDEDMLRSTARKLREAGFPAEDVRDIGLRGEFDRRIFEEAQARGALLVTGDMGFANAVRFPPGSHAGVLVVRFPADVPVERMNTDLVSVITSLGPDEVQGAIVIVEPSRVRIRRTPAT